MNDYKNDELSKVLLNSMMSELQKNIMNNNNMDDILDGIKITMAYSVLNVMARIYRKKECLMLAF